MIRVLGVSAPHIVKKDDNIESSSLNSSDPFSLYNAYKVCCDKAEKGDYDWSNSNWKTREGRNNSIMLLQYYENEVPLFIEKIKEIRPNILFIGTMALGMPGAVKLAEIAKDVLKDEVFIVVGGKHIIETLYAYDNNIYQLESSPLTLMKKNKIPKVFDMVSAGDGEEILYEIGKAVNYCDENNLPLKHVYDYKNFKRAKGYWVLGWLDDNNEYKYVVSNNEKLDYDSMPLTTDLFRTTAKFDIFDDCDLTAHTMSFMSKGCVHNCFYCSESSKINGPLCQVQTAPERLYKNLKSIERVGKELYNTDKMSAFIEDSILLSGNPNLLAKLSYLLKENPINVKFGAQFTIDRLLDKKVQNEIRKLSKQGFDYIFVGLETNNEEIAKTMSKNRNELSWNEKNEEAIKFINEVGMKYGVSVLLGLGENQEDRIKLMNTIKGWKSKYGIPNCISMNLAVQHPLQNNELYDYIEWGTDKDSEYLSIFNELFGEASEKYKLPNITLPTVEELYDIKKIYDEINGVDKKNIKRIVLK